MIEIYSNVSEFDFLKFVKYLKVFLNMYSKLYLIFLFQSSILFSFEIRINEFMASNVTTYPEMHDFSDYSDWIEIYNFGEDDYILNNVFLTDDSTNPIKNGIFQKIRFLRLGII